MFKALKVLTNKTKKDCCSIQILTVDEKMMNTMKMPTAANLQPNSHAVKVKRSD